MKKSSHTVGNRTRDLPACSALFQRIAPLPPNGLGGGGYLIGKDVRRSVRGRIPGKVLACAWVDREKPCNMSGCVRFEM